MNIPEFKTKGDKIQFETSNELLEKNNQAISSIEKGNVRKCQEMLYERNKLISKQQKSIRIFNREEDCWEVAKCYLSDNLASDSNNENHLLRARREAASDKKKRESAKQKERKNQFRDAPHYRKSFKFVSREQVDTSSSFRSNQHGSKVCFFCGKERDLYYSCP